MSHLWIFHLVCESHFRKRSWVFISLQRLWSAETFSRKRRRHESGEPHLRRIQETGDATMDRHPPCSAADARQVWSDSLLTLKWINSVFVFKSQDDICPAVAGFISDSTSWSFSQNCFQDVFGSCLHCCLFVSLNWQRASKSCPFRFRCLQARRLSGLQRTWESWGKLKQSLFLVRISLLSALTCVFCP